MGIKLVLVLYCLDVIFLLAIFTPYSQAAHSAAAPAQLFPTDSSRLHMHTYLVHVPAKKKPPSFTSLRKWHVSLLAGAVVGSAASAPETRLLYSYEVVMQGFAALLSLEEVGKLREMEVVEIVFEDSIAQIHTTRTPAFLGLAAAASSTGNIKGPWRAAKQGQNVIIGVLDSGIWPEHPSFSDHAGFSAPIPSRWKGTCESSPSFNSSLCNRKLIGARAFFRGFEALFQSPLDETMEYKSPRDALGHGTHTASTASGRIVPNASLSGAARGNASGMAPLSHIAMYKVCWLPGVCIGSDILAGFEAAIIDGVDVISASIGGGPAVPFFQDPTAIGAFAAVARGIITSFAAGNSGPTQSSIGNLPPWIFSIAASSIDRDFPASVMLGNGQQYKGASFWYAGEEEEQKQLPLVYAADAVVPGGNASIARQCLNPELLIPHAVKRKIVLCDHDGFFSPQTGTGSTIKKVGGAGMILGSNFMELGEDLTDGLQYQILPATLVGYSEARKIKQYINSTSNRPTAQLEFRGTRVGVKPAPVMAAFSSLGPNPVTPEILKPDVTAPGVNILAAWIPFHATASTKRQNHFKIESGTSMACPHVAGITALLKAFYPTWSPAAIRSALMTTATTIDNTGKTITDGATGAAADPTAYGSGHIHPTAAFNPGLVYDISTQDYRDFVCSLNYTNGEMSIFVGSQYKCSKSSTRKPGDLNYPSFSVVYDENKSSSYEGTFTRTLTNVGPANSTYRVSVERPSQVGVSVKPSELSFVGGKQKLSYSITFRASKSSTNTSAFGYLVWSDGSHRVRSPISFSWRT